MQLKKWKLYFCDAIGKAATRWDSGELNLIDARLLFRTRKYSGIHPVLWDSPLLCSKVAEDKSPKTDVVETYMKII